MPLDTGTILAPPERLRDLRPAALDIIRHEYAEIMAQFAAADEAVTAEARRVMRAAVLDSLARHLDLKESVLYPAMEHVRSAASLRQASVGRHEALRDALVAARALDLDDPAFEDAFDVLRELFAAHRAEEERTVFPRITGLMREELPALAVELGEARIRLKGALGA